MRVDVTLSQELWQIVKRTFGRAGVPQVTEEERKHRRLYGFLLDQLKSEDDPLTIAMSPGQQKRLLEIMRRPPAPWAMDALDEYIMPIWQALGWADDLNDEEEDE
jgi:hypothetical protein